MITRAKVYVSSVDINTNPHQPDNDWVRVKFNLVYSPDEQTENHKFWEASPSGDLEFPFIPKDKAEEIGFVPGAFFYVDVEETDTPRGWELPFETYEARQNALKELSHDLWRLVSCSRVGSNISIGLEQVNDYGRFNNNPGKLVVHIANKVVFPMFFNKVDTFYTVKLIPTTKEPGV